MTNFLGGSSLSNYVNTTPGYANELRAILDVGSLGGNTLYVEGEFSPSYLFVNGEAGGWYSLTYMRNAGDYPTYQTTSGTPSVNVGDPIGLYLSNPRDGRGIVNTLIYSDLSSATGWTADNTTSNFAGGYRQIVENSNTSVHTYFSASGSGVVSGETYSGYFVVKKGVLASAPDIIQVSTRAAGFGGGAYANFDLASGTVTQSANATAFIYDADNIPTHLNGVNLQTGEYLVGITTTATSTTSSNVGLLLSFVNNNPTAARTPSYAGSSDADVLVRAAQFQQGAPTAYQANGPYLGGPGEHFGQATSAARPTLGLLTKDGVPSILIPYYDGGDYLSLGKPALSDGCSLFADASQKWAVGGVYSTLAPGSTMFSCTASGTGKLRVFLNSQGLFGVICRSTATGVTGTVRADGRLRSWLLVWDGTDLLLYLDDVEAPYVMTVGTDAEQPTSVPTIGVNNPSSPVGFFTGSNDILLMRSGVMTTEEIAEWRQMVNSEYGIV